MAFFPDIVGSRRRIVPNYYTQVSEAGQQHRWRYRKALKPRFEIDLGWALLTSSEMQQIDDFVRSMSGAASAFDWWDWKTFHWIFLPVGTGDGSTSVFTLPAKSVSDLEVYVAGTLKTEPTHYTKSSGTGANGEDQITFTAGNIPASGTAIWCHALCKRKFTVTFAEDDQALSRILDIQTGRYDYATKFMGVK